MARQESQSSGNPGQLTHAPVFFATRQAPRQESQSGGNPDQLTHAPFFFATKQTPPQESRSGENPGQLTHAPLFFATKHTPSPKPTTPMPSDIHMPKLGQERSVDELFVSMSVLLVIIVVFWCSITKRQVARAARIQDRVLSSPRYATPPRGKRGFAIFTRDDVELSTDVSGVKKDAATEKGYKTVEENIQGYLTQNGGAEGRKFQMNEYARRKKREQEGYLVGY